MSDWSHFTCAMPKQISTLEAQLCLHMWREARETAMLIIEYAESCIAASHEMQNAEIEAKYRQRGLNVRARTVFCNEADIEGATGLEFIR